LYLLSVLLLGDLGGTFLVLVRLHDLVLQLLKLGGLCADAFDFLGASLVLNFETGHLSGELIFDLGGLSGHILGSSCHLCH
jgi:hypothetical protein